MYITNNFQIKNKSNEGTLLYFDKILGLLRRINRVTLLTRVMYVPYIYIKNITHEALVWNIKRKSKLLINSRQSIILFYLRTSHIFQDSFQKTILDLFLCYQIIYTWNIIRMDTDVFVSILYYCVILNTVKVRLQQKWCRHVKVWWFAKIWKNWKMTWQSPVKPYRIFNTAFKTHLTMGPWVRSIWKTPENRYVCVEPLARHCGS